MNIQYLGMNEEHAKFTHVSDFEQIQGFRLQFKAGTVFSTSVQVPLFLHD